MIVMATMADPGENRAFFENSVYNLDPAYAHEMIKKHKIGGIIFLGPHRPKSQIALTNAFQAVNDEPLLVFQDAEWGLSMRILEGVTVFPKAGATIVAYENEPEAQVAAAETILGVYNPSGQLPVSANDDYQEGLSLRFE